MSLLDHHPFRTKLLKFLGIGVVNTIVGYAIYVVLIYCDVPYLIALVLSTIAGVIFNYFSTGRLVFDAVAKWQTFAKFVAAYVVVYGVNAILLSVGVRWLGVGPYLMQILCLPPSVLTSWALMNHWVYKND